MPLYFRKLAVFTVPLVLFLLLAGCGRYMKLDGEITDVRVAPTSEESSVVVVDVAVTNNAKIGYVFREGIVEVQLGAETLTGEAISVRDTKQLCQFLEALKEKGCAEPLTTRETIPAGQQVKRVIAVSFSRPAADLKNRTGLRIRIIELDRLETELTEANPPGTKSNP